MNHVVSALALLFTVGPVYAGDLCKANSFTQSQAEQGKQEYNSSCGLCHLYNLKGRVPGESENETPDVRILNDNYIIDRLLNNAIMVAYPPREHVCAATEGFC